VVQTTHTPASTLDALTVSVNGLTLTNVTATGVTTVYAYDPLARRIAVTDGRGNTASNTYNTAGQLVSESRANGASPPFVTAYAYDPFTGRRVAVTNALGQATHTAYDAEGRVVATWGATYPVAYEYDALGRMSAMATTRDPAHESVNLLTLLPQGVHLSQTSHPSYPASLDTTRWLYHEPTGLLTNKLYADGNGTAYTYTPDGNLATRTWARLVVPPSGGAPVPLVTNYGYEPGGSLTNILYSDSTPAVSFAYDRLGRQLSAITAGVSTNLFAYDALTLALTNETIVAFGETSVLARSQDTFGRPAGIALSNPDTPTPSYAVAYGYDAYGRFHSTSSSVFSAVSVANYSYLPNSHFLSGYTVGDFSRAVTFEHNRDLIAAVSNTFGGTLVSAFDYASDALGRRTARVDAQPSSDPVQNVFGYNQRSEVQSALMGTNTYGYVFDPIGNRIVATNNAVATAYLANELNQYTNIVEGVAPSTPTYDEDGNIAATGDGWHFVWNGENRMILASNSAHVVTYAYDHQGRMTTKTVDGATRRYLWDGYNIVAEFQTAATNWFVWGLDLSGTLQGAGGVGGLLAEVKDGVPYFSAYDANGNVTEYIATNGLVAARYEYSPFGEIVTQSRNPALPQSDFLHSFSTKPWCEVTGLSEYELRTYSPGLGRWLSRDPIDEDGWSIANRAVLPPRLISRDPRDGYSFVLNDSLSHFDKLGLLRMKTKDGPLDKIPLFGSDSRCGDLHWRVHFVPEKSLVELSGYIIQEASVYRGAKTWPGKAPIAGYPYHTRFYEAFEVKDGEVVEDNWTHTGPGRCTVGYVQMTGKAAFFHLGKLPPSFIPNNPACLPWSSLPCTRTKPLWFGKSSSWISNYIDRTLNKWWRCCADMTSGVGASPLNVP
jgi:RHS repeat-associated protein